MRYDLCPTRDKYYIQTNNEINPYDACQVTSMVMGLDIGGFGLEPIQNLDNVHSQPEDKLRYYMMTDPEIIAKCQIWHPGAINPPPEWADVMSYTINKLYGREITKVDTSFDNASIIRDLMNALPIYVSCRYPKIAGHLVLIVGADTDRGVFYINDPYKNHLTGDGDGFKCIYKYDEFWAHFKGHGIRYRRLK